MIHKIKRRLHKLSADKKFSEILTGSTYALAARVVATGLSMLVSIVIARYFGAEVIGILAVLNSFILLATIVPLFGANTSILRLIPEHVTKYSVTSGFRVYRKILYFVILGSLAVGTFLFIVSDAIATNIFNKPHLAPIFSLAACFVVVRTLMDLSTQSIRGLKLIRSFALMQILPPLSMLLFLLLISIFFSDSNIAIYAQFAAWGVTGLVGVLIIDFAFRQRMRPKDPILNMTISEILSISFPMLLTTTMQFVMGQTGVIILGMSHTETEVGYYAVAVKLATLTTFVLSAINSMAAPKFSELYHAGKIDDLIYVARKSTKLIFWTTVPISLGLIAFGIPILEGLFGTQFVVAYWAMFFLLVGQTINSLSGSTGYFLNMTGYQKVTRNILSFSALLNVGLCFLLIPKFGIYGAAISGMSSTILWNIIALIFIKIKLGISIWYLPFTRS